MASTTSRTVCAAQMRRHRAAARANEQFWMMVWHSCPGPAMSSTGPHRRLEEVAPAWAAGTPETAVADGAGELAACACSGAEGLLWSAIAPTMPAAISAPAATPAIQTSGDHLLAAALTD